MKLNFSLFKLIERVGARGWRGVLENTRRLTGLFVKVLYCVTGGPSKGHCIALYAMSKRIIEISRKSGLLFTGMYLKQVSFMLQWYIGGERHSRPKLPIFISLTRSGIPRFIPPIYRKRLRGEIDPTVVKIVLSVCTLSRLILIYPRSKKYIDTTSIQPEDSYISADFLKISKEIQNDSFTMFKRYVPDLLEHTLELGYKFRPMFSSGPNSCIRPQHESYLTMLGIKGYDKLTPYHTLTCDGYACLWWWWEMSLMKIGDLFYADRIFRPGEEVTPSGFGLSATNPFYAYLRLLKKSYKQTTEEFNWVRPVEMARLGRKLEGSGKVRIFVMGNPVFQTVLRPIHDWSMGVLRSLGTDGTYNQHRPLDRLIGIRVLYSYDLKSATDLFPAELIRSLVISFFGIEFGTAWYDIITGSEMKVPDDRYITKDPRRTRFTRGQPLGLYSSWSLFTMTHHMIVWMAAERVYPGRVFLNYAILGDDLVIGDAYVAKEYSILLTSAGGVISKEKSLISQNGCLEFAKRFIIKNHLDDRMDVSPLSLPLIRTTDRYVAPFIFTSLGASIQGSFRIKGASYRVYSHIQENRGVKSYMPHLSRKWQRLLVGLFSASGPRPLPTELWLTFPDFWLLDCYIKGFLYEYLLAMIKPKDLDYCSFQAARLLWSVDHEELFEAHLLTIVTMHVNYIVWYAKAVSWRHLTISELLRPPVSPTTLDRSTERQKIHRYGPLYKVWDFCRLNRNIVIYILCEGDGRSRKDFVYLSIFRWKFPDNTYLSEVWC
nr:MAG: putative RNA-dependent RNA polymerase [Mitoviridae sp.]